LGIEFDTGVGLFPPDDLNIMYRYIYAVKRASNPRAKIPKVPNTSQTSHLKMPRTNNIHCGRKMNRNSVITATPAKKLVLKI
jgi:hypothetical protein